MTRQHHSDAPKALVITRNLPPLVGGMETLNLHLLAELGKKYRLTVVGPYGCRAHISSDINVIEVPVRPLGRFLCQSLMAAWRKASAEKPVFVIAGSGLMAPAAKIAAWRSGGRAIAYVHGLDLVAQHPIYRMIWIPFLRMLDHAWANSASTADVAARMGVAKRRITVLHPGVSLPDRARNAGASFRAEHALSGKILLSVGRLTARKGLARFIRNALPMIRSRHPDVTLLVIGEEAADALNDRGVGVMVEILRAIADVGMGDAVIFMPHCSEEELAGAYQAADIHVFPVVPVKGDIEGFGMVAIEAASHGLPTVAFAVGGIPDAVAPGVSGRLLAPGDYSCFAQNVINLLEKPDDNLRLSAIQFAARFEWAHFGDKLRRTLDNLLTETNESIVGHARHAILDLPSRILKAKKIEAVLGLAPNITALRILEIGTGSGGIAHYFGSSHSPRYEVHAVDVHDARQVFDGYRFQVVDGVELPFDDGSFDVVISNHVIEHVGSRELQVRHLAEMRRVLSPAGRGYLAVPNRWMIVEPHYGLAFLSWLPRSLRSRYLKWRRGIDAYDCEPLEVGEIEQLFTQTGVQFERAVGCALKATIALEGIKYPALRKLIERLPDSTIDKFAVVVPTLVYRFSHRDQLSGFTSP